MRQKTKKGNGEKKARFKPSDGAERSDMTRLGMILSYGFGHASGYSTLSRDRFEVNLEGGKTLEQLRAFCSKHLRGSPVPGTDPIQDGPVLLRMFQAAEMEGLVKVKFQKAGRFIPEKGM
jgi:hypothetical protein